MHIILARSLAILGIFTYSSTALVPDTVGFQNGLGYSVAAESSVSPTTIKDFTPLLPSSVSATSSDKSLPTIAIDRRMNTGAKSGEKLHARDLGSLGQQGLNIATYADANPTNVGLQETPEFQSLQFSIAADPSFSGEFLTPTTTVIDPAPTIYYTEATATITQTTITVTARGIDALETNSALLPLSRAPPQTFQTITGSPALASSIVRQGKERRDFDEDKAACEALVSSEVINCLETKGLLVPWTTITEVVDGATMFLVEVSVAADRRRRDVARVTGRV